MEMAISRKIVLLGFLYDFRTKSAQSRRNSCFESCVGTVVSRVVSEIVLNLLFFRHSKVGGRAPVEKISRGALASVVRSGFEICYFSQKINPKNPGGRVG